MWTDLVLSIAILCLCCLLLGAAGAGWWMQRQERCEQQDKLDPKDKG